MCCAHPPGRSAVCVPRRDTRWLPRHLGQRDSSRSAPSRFGRRGPLPRVRVEAGARAVYSALPPEASFEPRCPVCLLEPQDQHPGTSVRSPCCPQGRRTTQGLPASGSTVRPVRVRIPEPPTAALLSGRRHPHFTGGGLQKKKTTGKCRETKAEKTAHGTPTSQPSLVLRTSPTRPTRLS